MRLTFFMAAGLAALAAVPAAAQSTGTVAVNGSVANRCLFTTPSEVINAGELSQAGTGGTAGRLDVAKLNGQSRNLVGWCNGTAATMSVEAQPLLNTTYTSTPPTGFDRRVDYTATAVANSVTATDSSTVAGAGTAQTVGLFTGNVAVTLSAASSPTSGLLVAGSYSGQVLVVLTPTVALPPA